MATTRERSPLQAWIADFIVAGLLAVIVTFFLMDWLADRACTAAGGVVRHAGADAFCETPGRSDPLAGLVKGSSILYVWMAATAVFLVLARWFINRPTAARPRRSKDPAAPPP